MAVSYKLLSKTYGLLDIIYFKNNSPRLILMNKIPNGEYKILEIAIGTAENSIILAKNKPELKIVGIDLSDEMLEIANNRVIENNIKNIELIKMDGTNIKFDKNAFDFIIISLLLHELTEGVANKILKECKNVLKQNGKIYVLEWENPKKIIQKIIFSVIKLLEPKEYKHFMKKDLNKYFYINGFQITNIEYGDYSKVIELGKSETST